MSRSSPLDVLDGCVDCRAANVEHLDKPQTDGREPGCDPVSGHVRPMPELMRRYDEHSVSAGGA